MILGEKIEQKIQQNFVSDIYIYNYWLNNFISFLHELSKSTTSKYFCQSRSERVNMEIILLYNTAYRYILYIHSITYYPEHMQIMETF